MCNVCCVSVEMLSPQGEAPGANKTLQHDNCTFVLRMRGGGKNLTLEYADRTSYDENRVNTVLWVELLRYLIVVAADNNNNHHS